MVHIYEVRFLSKHDLLHDDSEAVDISFLSSIDRSSCHTQQLRCCPQLIAIEIKLANLCTDIIVSAICTRDISLLFL